MRGFIEAFTAIIVITFLILIAFITIVVFFGNWDTARMDRVIWTYVISGFMVLCNGVVYAILSRQDTQE